MKIGIAGGGFAGLTAAYRLSKEGHSVVVLEKEGILGGLANAFDFAGAKLDKFYRHIFSSDTEIISLIEELGLKEDLLWLESKMGFYYNGKTYPFSTPLDILFKFKALPLPEIPCKSNYSGIHSEFISSRIYIVL